MGKLRYAYVGLLKVPHHEVSRLRIYSNEGAATFRNVFMFLAEADLSPTPLYSKNSHRTRYLLPFEAASGAMGGFISLALVAYALRTWRQTQPTTCSATILTLLLPIVGPT